MEHLVAGVPSFLLLYQTPGWSYDMRSYEEDEDQMSFVNMGSCLGMDAHGLYCICRIPPTIFEEPDTAGEYSTDI